MTDISRNIEILRTRIERSACKSDRKPDEIILIGASKTILPEKIKEAFDLGVRRFGENRVAEAVKKMQSLPSDVEWHMIGHLQSNKTKLAVESFHMIQSVDSVALARKIHTVSDRMGRKTRVLLEVNIGREPSKCGFKEDEVFEAYQEIISLGAIEIEGLMCVAPYRENTEDVRPFFCKMKLLFEKIGNLKILSMGMSRDFTIAIEEGSNMIRIGEALFGERI